MHGPGRLEVTDSDRAAPITALRTSFERVRALPPEQQVDECVDQLGQPELIVAELVDSIQTVDSWLAAIQAPDGDDACEDRKREPTLVESYIYEGRDLSVVGQPCAFTCLSTNVNPLPGTSTPDPKLSSGLDYVGLTCDRTTTPVLGAVQAPGDATAYPLLLRALACLSEMVPKAQTDRLNQRFFRGALESEPVFDLNLVVWDLSEEEEVESIPIYEFTRDLSETVKRAVLERLEVPRILRDIVCLRMNPTRFDGRLRFDWRV
jgi:hypothetical protein